MPTNRNRGRRSLRHLIRPPSPRLLFMTAAAIILGLLVDDAALAIVLLLVLYGLTWLPNILGKHRHRGG